MLTHAWASLPALTVHDTCPMASSRCFGDTGVQVGYIVIQKDTTYQQQAIKTTEGTSRVTTNFYNTRSDLWN